MKTITQIKVWKSEKGEIRIYITFEGCKEQGCYYKDGNNWQANGMLQNMTDEDKQNAIALCEKAIGKRAWVTLYSNQIENLNKHGKTTAPVVQKTKIETKPAEMSKEEMRRFHYQMSRMEDAETFGYREKVNYTQRPSIEEDYA